MKLILCFYLIVCLCNVIITSFANPTTKSGQNWAVLVAGSSTYYNYRHQANLCHAYQDLVAHGIPQSNIITMMYDDVANDPANPHPGVLINQPNGPDVYHGVIKDCTGNEVTPPNFLKVLLGDSGLKAAGKKVLESGQNDNVFIYFTDHGGPLIVGFPNDELHASDLISTLKQMHAKKMYNKLLFYMEACESGSMFDGLLPNDISVHGISSTSPDDPGYACFCNVSENTCLGDEFSVNWLLNSDVGKDFGGETIRQQFLLVKNETTDSVPLIW
ncbi:legumain-like [Brevipalpus obovatus]|uniref:legumain-like n=1 Tax=Brevipalpus obovatus TaxID=246614 RepID=UPI003D9E0016